MTETLPEHHSAVRSMTAKSVGKEYRAVKSLEEAQAEQDFAVIFEVDFGGQIYLTCPALEMKCNENTLHQLLLDIDDLNWEHPAAAGLYFEYLPVGSGVAGGMGGGRVTANLWIHPELHELGLANLIADVIDGRTVRLDAPTPEEMESRAANGDANAQYLLANKKRQTEPARSLELLRASASRGNLGAMSQIWRGNIAGQEKEKWLNMLAARTETDSRIDAARSQLGQACVKGGFGTIDHARATTLLLQACERQWSAYDAFQLGKMYRDGLGVQQSQVTALAWFLLASVFDVRQYPQWRIVIRRDTQPYVLESIEKLKSVMSSSSVAEAEKLSQDIQEGTMKNPQEQSLLILDLDETLIHSCDCELERPPNFRISDYYVYCRPHLDRFLQLRSRDFELAIWSSGSASYVQEIAKKIIPGDVKLSFVWSRDRCGFRRDLETDETYFQKDLKKVTKLGYSLSKILILEDKKENVRRHFGNAVYIKPFYGDPSDVELEKIGPFLEHLSTVPNVRTIEKRNWASYREPN